VPRLVAVGAGWFIAVVRELCEERASEEVQEVARLP
jgi:hypothetical protein